MVEIDQHQPLTKEQVKEISEELKTLREWTNGWGAPSNLIIPENFPSLAEHAPASLVMFQKLAEGSFNMDIQKLKLIDKYPEIWSWPEDKERAFLITAANLGLGLEALQTLKNDYKKRINEDKTRRTGFEV